MAKYLRVEIKRSGEVVVSLEFPARSVEFLESMMPAAVVNRLSGLGLDLNHLMRQAIDSGLVPQKLFESTAGDRSYRVWLE